ncbi:hypothetical protein BDV98DRAFT_591508 [Pterulicium gracile]|uniref:Uncharacterized protein n=1 Tax=Pterulicium gracile TaxID=1884261 RepID=A0A5C3QT26_9AGAR|nr:hypothetical protein BDV98DRAFT_591508 [Pterula gracilis]
MAEQKPKTLLQSYQALPPKTRLLFSVSVLAFAGLGMLVSDQLEQRIPANVRQEQTKPPSS